METPLQLDVLGPSEAFRSRTPEPVIGLHGQKLALLSLAPPVYVDRAMRAVQRSHDLPEQAREAALARAGEIFRSGAPNGLATVEYQALVAAATGLPRSIIESSTERIAVACERAFESAWQARPVASVLATGETGSGGSGIWVRRGRTLAVLAAGNHPAVHANWVEALALGYRIVVRPSRREPFTAYRLVLALREAGFPDAYAVFLPSGHEAADAIVRGSDRSMVYGGDDVVRRYAADPGVLPQGPGRAKILIPHTVDPREQLDLVVESVTRNAGVSCTNTTAVLVEGDAALFAEELSVRLASIPSRDPRAPDAVLPAVTIERARQLRGFLATVAEGSRPLLGAENVIDDLGDGTAVLRPAVHLVESAQDPRIQLELPFPCVWIAPWSPIDGVDALAGTLILTIADPEAHELAEAALQHPTIRNVYLGQVPTTRSSLGLPHDDYLAGFLMESKTFVRGRPSVSVVARPVRM